MFLHTYVNHDQTQEVCVFKHKGFIVPRTYPHDNVHIQAFLPNSRLWHDLNDKTLLIAPKAMDLTVHYTDVDFCPGFGTALTKASAPCYVHPAEWPPEIEAHRIIIHSIGS